MITFLLLIPEVGDYPRFKEQCCEISWLKLFGYINSFYLFLQALHIAFVVLTQRCPGQR